MSAPLTAAELDRRITEAAELISVDLDQREQYMTAAISEREVVREQRLMRLKQRNARSSSEAEAEDEEKRALAARENADQMAHMATLLSIRLRVDHLFEKNDALEAFSLLPAAERLAHAEEIRALVASVALYLAQ
jgi:hypothetical protein